MNKQEEIKEAIAILKKYVSDWNCASADEYPLFTDKLGHACNFSVSALQQQLTNGWIPVSEHEPETGSDMLVCTVNREVIHAYYSGDKKWHIANYYSKIIQADVIAWQPLPESYKGE